MVSTEELLSAQGFTQGDLAYMRGLRTQYNRLVIVQKAGCDIVTARENVRNYKAMMVEGGRLDPARAQRIDKEARKQVVEPMKWLRELNAQAKA